MKGNHKPLYPLYLDDSEGAELARINVVLFRSILVGGHLCMRPVHCV